MLDAHLTDPAFTEAMAAWVPKADAPPLFGLDRTPKPLPPSKPWRWYHRALWTFGSWLERMGRRIRSVAP